MPLSSADDAATRQTASTTGHARVSYVGPMTLSELWDAVWPDVEGMGDVELWARRNVQHGWHGWMSGSTADLRLTALARTLGVLHGQLHGRVERSVVVVEVRAGLLRRRAPLGLTEHRRRHGRRAARREPARVHRLHRVGERRRVLHPDRLDRLVDAVRVVEGEEIRPDVGLDWHVSGASKVRLRNQRSLGENGVDKRTRCSEGNLGALELARDWLVARRCSRSAEREILETQRAARGRNRSTEPAWMPRRRSGALTHTHVAAQRRTGRERRCLSERP